MAPVHIWACGTDRFPPAGASFYDGDTFPGWQGTLFVGNLAGQYLGRFGVDGRSIEQWGRLLADRAWRIRAVAVAPDTGRLYWLSTLRMPRSCDWSRDDDDVASG